MEKALPATAELLGRLAELSGTNADDWYATFKARQAMQVAFDTAARTLGRREVLTQLFTCVTAVDPIVAAGLTPRYADISGQTLALDPELVEVGEEACAVVAQHSFGIIDVASVTKLRAQAHTAGALLVEDCAHCVGRMARDANGVPLADLSFHSFGVEKMLPGVYFGGAVWVNPALSDDLRQALRESFEALPPLPPAVERATHRYRNQMRVLTRLPHAASVALRKLLERSRLFEPAVAEAEQRGQVSHEPCLPSAWVAGQALAGLSRLDANEEQRRACMEAYLKAFAQVPDECERLFIPAAVRGSAADQPLLRFPVVFASTALAEQAIAAVAAQGHYAQAWPRPLLLPGALAPEAYGLAQGTGAWPVSERLSAGIVGLPTDIDPAAVPVVAEAMLALAGL